MADRISHVDGLRGIASLVVVVAHNVGETALLWPNAFYNNSIQKLITADLGRIGVVAFFCVSGFLIPFTFGAPGLVGVKTFVIRRASRILPAFWLSIPVMILAAMVDGRFFGWVTVLANALILTRTVGVEPVSGVYWTLEVEVIFYALCVGIFLCGMIRKPSWLFVVAAGAFLISIAIPYIFARAGVAVESDRIGFLRVISFYLSVMLVSAVFRLWIEGEIKSLVHIFLLSACGLGLTVAMPLYYMVSHKTTGSDIYVGTSLGLLLFLSAFVAKTLFSNFLLLGRISYSLYLFHPAPLMLASTAARFGYLGPDGLRAALIFAVVTTLSSICVAAIVYRFVESPGIDLGHAVTTSNSLAAS